MTPRLHRGSVVASAFWLDPRWRTAAELHRDALALWRAGTIVQQLDGGLLVRLPAPMRVVCADAPGLVLVQAGDGLWAWAPTPEELAAAPAAHVHRLAGGLPVRVPLAGLRDAELWRVITVDGPLLEVAPLGPPPPALPVPVVPDTRARMGRPPADPAAVAIAEELARGSYRPPDAGAGWLAGAAAALLGWLDRRKAAAGGGAIGGNGRGAAGEGSLALPAPQAGWLEAMTRRLAMPLLAPLLVRRHGRYVDDLLDLFEKGDLDGALRRAIPLGGEGGTGEPLPPALGLPTPRADLTLSRGPARIGSAIGVGGETLQALRDTYQRAYEKLVAEGRVEDAAFVLVELLREPRKAVDLLEKHEKWELAAEIAEATHLGVEVVVRLRVRGGQLDRALSLARRTASFATCVPVIEAADPDRGRAFRAAWAAHLAAGGDPAAAVGVCWPVPSLRPLALRWLDDALVSGGAAAVKLVPLRLVADPDRFGDVRAAVEPLLAGSGPEERALRVALAEGLCEAPSPGSRALARPLLRRLVADQAAAPADVPLPLLARLGTTADDAALRLDLPPAAPVPALDARRPPVRVTIDASDRGTAPVVDIAALPRGRMLLALGEAGCRVVDRAGRVLAVLDEPADALVVHDAGTRAIAVARRDGANRLARLDLEAGTAARWIEAPMGPITTTFDGSLWFVADGDALLALDPLAERPSVLWRVATGGPISHVARGRGGMSVVVGGNVRQVWRYTLPNLRLTERAPLPDDDWPGAWLGGDATLVQAQRLVGAPESGEGAALPLRLCVPGRAAPESRMVSLDDTRPGLQALRIERTPSFGMVVLAWDGGAGVRLFDAALEHERVRLDLGGASRVVTRIGTESLAAADDLGRAEVISLAHGTRAARARS